MFTRILGLVKKNQVLVYTCARLCHSHQGHNYIIVSCCAVARAQNLGQKSRFAQQPPRGSIFGEHHFHRRFLYCASFRLFFAKKKLKHIFYSSP